MLAGKGVTAWRRALASLAPAAPAIPADPPAGPLPTDCVPALPAHLAGELINVLAALTLTST